MSRLPPPPYSTVLRAISLAAVTSLVRSTSPMPTLRHHPRTTCRTLTMSCCARTAICSCRVVSIVQFQFLQLRRQRTLQHGDAFFDVEGGLHSREREPELDERDGHGG